VTVGAPGRHTGAAAATRTIVVMTRATQSWFALPARLYDPRTGALELPAFGTPEFVNVVTAVGVIVALALVFVDGALRVCGAYASERGGRGRGRGRRTTLAGRDGGAVSLKLMRRVQISPDTVALTFALPTPEHVLGLPVGQHVGISYVDEKTGAREERPYTPTSGDDEPGKVEFVIKVYKPCEKFPLGGKVSQYLDGLRVGDSCDFTGPKGMKTYQGRGVFAVQRLRSQGGGFEKRKCARLGMIAGGSGITPMLQVSRAILGDSRDKVKMSLLFANQTEKDILCRDLIEADVEKYGEEKFSADYTLDRPPAKGWTHFSGFITKEMIEKTMPPPGKDTQIIICGPPPMLRYAVLPALEELGYTKDMYLTW
jgi:cytochrome-b5 reductase